MAYLNVTINSPETVGQLNQDILFDSTKPLESIRTLVAFLEALEIGAKTGPDTISIVVRSTNPSVTANGGGSSASYNVC